MTFGMLPPEINSGRMYSGSGPGPLLAAAAAWEALAAELASAAAAYQAEIAGLTGSGWSGPSAQSMVTAVAPYVAWMSATAAQAEQAAIQASATVAAYEAAFAATVPPPVIAANRSLLATLIATNFLGFNAPAIAAAELHYLEMWEQDAAAMYSYAAAASTTTQLTAFSEPPQTTTVAGLAAQGAATQIAGAGSTTQSTLAELIGLLPDSLHGLAAAATVPSAAASELESIMSSLAIISANLTGAYSPVGLAGIPGGWWLTFGQILGLAQNAPGVAALLSGPKPISGVLHPIAGGYVSTHTPSMHTSILASANLAGGPVTGALGNAGMIGGLTVPASWTSTVPSVSTAAIASAGVAPVVAAGGQTALFTEMALSSLAGRAAGAAAARPIVNASGRIVGSTAVVAAEADEDDANVVNIIVIPAEE